MVAEGEGGVAGPGGGGTTRGGGTHHGEGGGHHGEEGRALCQPPTRSMLKRTGTHTAWTDACRGASTQVGGGVCVVGSCATVEHCVA
jgi:hypothetical protein